MKFIMTAFAAIIIICSSNHANADYLKKNERKAFWEKTGLYRITEFVTADVRWEPGYKYSITEEFPEFRCYQNTINCQALRGQYDRERSEWFREKDRAYQCYRFGKGCDVCNRPSTSPGGGCTETKPAQYPLPQQQPAGM